MPLNFQCSTTFPLSDFCADLCLGFTNLSVLLCIIAIVSLLLGANFVFQTICLIALSVLINVALKGAFKIPLSPKLHLNGYAFPSGHMQLATVFYGWLALYLPFKWYRCFFILVLAGVGISLCHYDYHSASDIIAGLACGFCIIQLYQYILHHFKTTHIVFGVWFLSSTLIIWVGIRYTIIPSHAYVAYIVLLVCLILERVLYRRGFIACWQPIECVSMR